MCDLLSTDVERWDDALAAAQRLPATALLLQSLCVLEGPITPLLPWPQGCPAGMAGQHRLLLLAAPLLAVLLFLRIAKASWRERPAIEFQRDMRRILKPPVDPKLPVSPTIS